MDKNNSRAYRKYVLRIISHYVKSFCVIRKFPDPEPICLGQEYAVYRINGRDIHIPIYYQFVTVNKYRTAAIGFVSFREINQHLTCVYYTDIIDTLYDGYDEPIDFSRMVMTEFGDKEQR